MRGFFNGLVIGIVIGAAGYWFAQNKMREHPDMQQRAETSAAEARASASDAAGHLSDSIQARMEALDLRSDQIKDELAHTGKIVRSRAQNLGEKMADAAADAGIVAAIKGKYATDSKLSVWQISVSCKNGHVSLSGMVPTTEDIGRAVALALEADGVIDVSSTLQAKSNS